MKNKVFVITQSYYDGDQTIKWVECVARTKQDAAQWIVDNPLDKPESHNDSVWYDVKEVDFVDSVLTLPYEETTL
jgi:hypothetical protein